MRYQLRPILKKDNQPLREVILNVLKEYNCEGPGYASSDKEMEDLFASYSTSSNHHYLVVEGEDGLIYGGAGIAPLEGGPPDVVELRKMYLLPQARGCGNGKALINDLLGKAKELGFKKCYLETVPHMTDAQKLYEKAGFRTTDRLGDTGHFNCGVCLIKTL